MGGDNRYKFISERITIFESNYPKTTRYERVGGFEGRIVVNCEDNFNKDEKMLIEEFNINTIDDLVGHRGISTIDKERSLKCYDYVRGGGGCGLLEPFNGHNSIKLGDMLIYIRIMSDGSIKYCKSL
jgi:hypothetical protein